MPDTGPDEKTKPGAFEASTRAEAMGLLRRIACADPTVLNSYTVAVSEARHIHEVIHDLQTELAKTKNDLARLKTDTIRAEQRAGLARLEAENTRLVTSLVDTEAKLDKARRAAKSYQQLSRRIEAKKGKK